METNWKPLVVGEGHLVFHVGAHDSNIVALGLVGSDSVRLVWQTYDGLLYIVRTRPGSGAKLFASVMLIDIIIGTLWLRKPSEFGLPDDWSQFSDEASQLRAFAMTTLTEPDWFLEVEGVINGERMLVAGKGPLNVLESRTLESVEHMFSDVPPTNPESENSSIGDWQLIEFDRDGHPINLLAVGSCIEVIGRTKSGEVGIVCRTQLGKLQGLRFSSIKGAYPLGLGVILGSPISLVCLRTLDQLDGKSDGDDSFPSVGKFRTVAAYYPGVQDWFLEFHMHDGSLFALAGNGPLVVVETKVISHPGEIFSEE